MRRSRSPHVSHVTRADDEGNGPPEFMCHMWMHERPPPIQKGHPVKGCQNGWRRESSATTPIRDRIIATRRQPTKNATTYKGAKMDGGGVIRDDTHA